MNHSSLFEIRLIITCYHVKLKTSFERYRSNFWFLEEKDMERLKIKLKIKNLKASLPDF